MAQYIEVTIKYDKMLEDGKVKRVSEHYLVDAMSLTEAEAVVTEKMKPYISGEFVATSAKQTKIAELIGGEADKYWLAKVAFVTIDEKTAKEKRTVSQMLVGADDFKEAYEVFADGMKGTVADYELVSLSLSQIVDVFKA